MDVSSLLLSRESTTEEGFIPRNKRLAWKSRVHRHHQKLGISKPTATPSWQVCERNKYDISLLLVSRTSWHKNIKQEIQSPLCLIPVTSQDTCTKILASPLQNCPDRCEGQRNDVAVLWHAHTQCGLKGLFYRDEGKKREIKFIGFFFLLSAKSCFSCNRDRG